MFYIIANRTWPDTIEYVELHKKKIKELIGILIKIAKIETSKKSYTYVIFGGICFYFGNQNLDNLDLIDTLVEGPMNTKIVCNHITKTMFNALNIMLQENPKGC